MAEQATTKPTAVDPNPVTETSDAAAESQPPATGAAGVAPGPSVPVTATTDDDGNNKSPASPSAASKGKGKETVDAGKRDSLSIDRPDDAGAPSTPANPTCNITLLLPTGARHPYKIDERYLSKRNVEIPELTEDGKADPFSISVYKLKELILLEWREEWEGKPASPTSIRLIHFGKLLDDKEQLKKYQFSSEAPNVIHMSVRPAEMMEEEEGAKGKTSSSGGRTQGSGNCCVIL
ncbi:hypothetical protein RB595_006389 [Gaeumannomyces hyphopodioides]